MSERGRATVIEVDEVRARAGVSGTRENWTAEPGMTYAFLSQSRSSMTSAISFGHNARFSNACKTAQVAMSNLSSRSSRLILPCMTAVGNPKSSGKSCRGWRRSCESVSGT